VTTWFTSDLHFGHERVLGLSRRPFASVREMNDALVWRWNQVVAPSDVVWVLGDVAINRGALSHVSRLNGVKILVCGNHDLPWEHNVNWRKHVRTYMEAGFTFVYTEGYALGHEVGAGGPVVNLSHLPYRGGGDHTAVERFPAYRLADEGRALLCGHVHGAWKTARTAAGTVQVNVGVDQWGYAPVSEEAVRKVLEESSWTGREPWHGTPNGYSYHGCKCAQCRRAKADEQARNVAARALLPWDEIPHGTENGYGNYKCRCGECREAHRVDGQRRRLARAARRAGGLPQLPVPD
jgi:calcineurin-like phosphoesterase family protein